MLTVEVWLMSTLTNPKFIVLKIDNHLVNVNCECPHTLYFFRSNMNETPNQLRLMTNNEIQIVYCFKKKGSQKNRDQTFLIAFRLFWAASFPLAVPPPLPRLVAEAPFVVYMTTKTVRA